MNAHMPFFCSKGLVANYGKGGGSTQGEGGGHVKFYPNEKGDRKGFNHAEGGGGTTSFWVVFTR